MPRIRSLKPEALTHRKVGTLSNGAFRLWIGLITLSDDDGRCVADTEQLRLAVFGYRPEVTAEGVEQALHEIAQKRLIILYRRGHTRYACFPSWHDHQRIHKHHYTPSKLPPYNGRRTVQVPYQDGTATVGSERIGKERKGTDLRARAKTPPRPPPPAPPRLPEGQAPRASGDGEEEPQPDTPATAEQVRELIAAVVGPLHVNGTPPPDEEARRKAAIVADYRRREGIA
jgi:hypothetical protein